MKFNAEEANEDLTHKHTYAKDMLMYANDKHYLSTNVDTNKDILLEELHKDSIRKPMSNLRLITGGGEPPSSTGNWLLDLPIGTRFAVAKRPTREDPNNPMCIDLELMNKTGKTVLLFDLTTGAPFGGSSGRFIASKFTQLFEKVEILPSYEEMVAQALEEGEKDNDGNRTDALEAGGSSGDVDHDAGIKG